MCLQLKKHISIDCPFDHIVRCWKMEFPDTNQQISLVRLKLRKGSYLISENSYWYGIKGNDLSALRHLPKVKLEQHTSVVKKGNAWHGTTTIVNGTKTLAPMVKLSVVGGKDRQRILPVIFSDNYVTLMPGEKRRIDIDIKDEDTRGEKPEIILEGMNLK